MRQKSIRSCCTCLSLPDYNLDNADKINKDTILSAPDQTMATEKKTWHRLGEQAKKEAIFTVYSGSQVSRITKHINSGWSGDKMFVVRIQTFLDWIKSQKKIMFRKMLVLTKYMKELTELQTEKKK